jgi:hypothetical protein
VNFFDPFGLEGWTPAKGVPNSQQSFPKGEGKKTDRIYGTDGKAVKDIDYGHDHGAGDPQAHDWDWSKTPPRQPGRPVKPGEIPNPVPIPWWQRLFRLPGPFPLIINPCALEPGLPFCNCPELRA